MIALAIEALRAGQSQAAVVRLLMQAFHCTRAVAKQALRAAKRLAEQAKEPK